MKVIALGNIPKQGSPIGMMTLIPDGDRGPTFGAANTSGISASKVAGFWTSPYNGIITAVYISVDQGGVRIGFRRKRTGIAGIPEIMINSNGYTLFAETGGANKVFTNLTDFIDVNVLKGDVFTTEILEVFEPFPSDVGGNILVQQTDGSLSENVQTISL